MHTHVHTRAWGPSVVARPRLPTPCRASKTASAAAAPPQLTAEEQRSLDAFLKAGGAAEERMLQVIKAGAAKQVEDLTQLEGAMLYAEQLHHQHLASPHKDTAAAAADAQDVDVWQPIFASSGGFPRLLYIPVPEFFDMHKAVPDATAVSISSGASIDISSSRAVDVTVGGQHPGAINVITQLGPLTTHFLGSCTWLSDREFAYSISRIRLDLGGSVTLPMPVRLENALSFFLVTPELACARSKLGGTMLLQANPAQGRQYFATW